MVVLLSILLITFTISLYRITWEPEELKVLECKQRIKNILSRYGVNEYQFNPSLELPVTADGYNSYCLFTIKPDLSSETTLGVKDLNKVILDLESWLTIEECLKYDLVQSESFKNVLAETVRPTIDREITSKLSELRNRG